MKFSKINRKIIKDSVDYSVGKITEIIKTVGPRESGSKECYQAQEMLRKDLENYADEIHYEEYKMAPKAFLHFTKTVSAGIIGAVAAGTALKFGKKKAKVLPHILAGGSTIAALGVTTAEFLLYKQFCDVFYKKITAKNLVATRKASEEIKKRIVISGHVDSAYEWRHIYYGKGKLMCPLMYTTIASGILSAILGTTQTVLALKDSQSAAAKFLTGKGYLFHLFTAVNMATLYAFVNFNVLAPGANDNLTGTMTAVSALKMLEDAGIRFKNTEVIAMITDGEEAGLRGAKAYAKAHYEEDNESGVETHVLCVDTLADIDYLNVYSRDMTSTVKHDPEFSQTVMDAAIESGHDNLKYANVFFGSSDAAAFTQAGYSATCLAAMDPSPADYYHNRRDSYDRLVPETIEAGYDIVLSTILKIADEEE